MSPIHKDRHPLSGEKVRLKKDSKHLQVPNFGGSEVRIEDWHDRVMGGSWMFANGNPAALIYAMRYGLSGLPTDNEVVYAKMDGFGHLIHVSELEDARED